MAINAVKDVPLSRVMAYENAPTPASLFTPEGVMHSGNKSDFLHKLVNILPEHMQNIKEIEGCDAAIHDGHAVVQAMGKPDVTNKTFNDMCKRFH